MAFASSSNWIPRPAAISSHLRRVRTQPLLPRAASSQEAPRETVRYGVAAGKAVEKKKEEVARTRTRRELCIFSVQRREN